MSIGKNSARVGVYKGFVRDQYVPYIFPQENGNKSDTRWAALYDLRGMGFLALGKPVFNFSAHYFTPHDFEQARHTFDLVQREFITLNLDYALGGLGSNSCGPRPLEKYLLKAEKCFFSFKLMPFHWNSLSPMSIYRLSS